MSKKLAEVGVKDEFFIKSLNDLKGVPGNLKELNEQKNLQKWVLRMKSLLNLCARKESTALPSQHLQLFWLPLKI